MMEQDLSTSISSPTTFHITPPGHANGISPISAYPVPAVATPRGRKRNSSLLDQSSPEIGSDATIAAALQDGHTNGSAQAARRAPGVKRACNECRQQKVMNHFQLTETNRLIARVLRSCDAMSNKNPSYPAHGA
jgi:hypothetical protein